MIARNALIGIAVCVGSLTGRPAFAAEPVGTVVGISDAKHVVISRPAGKVRNPTRFGTVYEGESFAVNGKEASVTVLLFSTQCLQTLSSGTASLTADGFSGSGQITSGDCLGRRNPQELTQTIGKLSKIGAVIARGSENDDRVSNEILPIDGSSVLDVSDLEFHWPSVPQAQAYRIELTTADAKPVWTTTTTSSGTECSGRAKRRIRSPLRYQWMVYVDDQEEPLFSGSFHVASQNLVEDAAVWADITSRTDDISLLLVAGAYYQHARLYGNALEVYERLVQLAPEQPAIHDGLSAMLLQAGRVDESEAARQRASELREQTESAGSE